MPRVLNIKTDGRPPAAVFIGRPSKWGNPFVIGRDGDRRTVVEKYRRQLISQPELVAAARAELAGKDLLCFCAPEACHGDVLLEAANSMTIVTSELTGQPIDTYSEQHRHECECRHILGLPDQYARNDMLAMIAKRRGAAASERIRVDVAVIFLLRQPDEAWPGHLESFLSSQGFHFTELVRIKAEGIRQARREAAA